MKVVLLAFLVLVANTIFAQDRFRNFLEGRWKNKDSDTFEQWDRTADGGLKGIGYTKEASGTVVMEYLEIYTRNNETVYSAFVPGQNGGAPVDFVLVRSDSVVVFENLNHDFPQRIAYHMSGKQHMRIEVSGSGGGDFSLHMVKQVDPPPAETDNPDFDAVLAEELGADDYGMKGYVMVILATGPNTTDDRDSISRAFAGHMKNITRLVEEEKIVIAGPFYTPPSASDTNARPYRGIFILDGVSDFSEAAALMKTDPAVREGFLATEFYHWYGSAALPTYLPYSDKIWKKAP